MSEITQLNEQLEIKRGLAQRLEKAERHSELLRKTLNGLKKRIVELEVELDLENDDVDKLLSLSWTNLFHTLLRSKDEQLQKERQEALAAALKLQQTREQHDRIKQELAEVTAMIAEAAGAEREYQALLRKKEAWIAQTGNESALQLEELVHKIAVLQDESREFTEAIRAGGQLSHALDDAAQALDKAKNWGTWDMLGGGMISTAIKHGNIDDARSHIANAEHLLHRFRKELSDLQQSSSISIDIGGFVSFADFFFDGLIADWIVQGRITGSLDQVREQQRKVERLLNRLSQQKGKVDGELSGSRYAKDKLVEELT